jgi:dihydrofolate reductase
VTKPKISIIVATTKVRLIGNRKTNDLLWHIPAELKRFKEITTGHPIIMGRKTYESIGRVLPNRTNIIITRDTNFSVPQAIVVHSLDEAIQRASTIDQNEIFIIGGGQIFEQALPLANKLYVTIVEGNFKGDVYFPDYSSFDKIIFQQKQESDGYIYTFYELERS